MEKKSTWHGIDRVDIPWYPTINEGTCIGCELCFVTCGKNVYSMGEMNNKYKAIVAEPYACIIGCTTCANICPTNAIEFPDPIIVLNAEREHKIFSRVHKEADKRREKIAKRNVAIQSSSSIGRHYFEIAGEVEKLNLSELRSLVEKNGCDLVDISINIPSIIEHKDGAPGIIRMTLIGTPKLLDSISDCLLSLVDNEGLTLSKHDKS